MALSMDEQNILDGMERKLADEDPRLAQRLARFGEPSLPSLLGSGRTRAVAVVVSLALAALMALMVYSMRPYTGSSGGGAGRNAAPSSHSSAAAAGRPGSSSTAARSPAGSTASGS